MIKKKESKYLEYVLLLITAANRNRPTTEKPCEIEIIIPLNNPFIFKLKRATRERFKCEIEEKAIIFFKSKLVYLKTVRETTIRPIRVNEKEITKEDRNLRERKNELKINLNKP